MNWASRRFARPSTLLVLFVLLLGITWAPGMAHAQAAGYCSELALSDVAPAPMVPRSDDQLAPGDCDSSDLTERGAPSPWDEMPAFSGSDGPERAWPSASAFPLGRTSVRLPVQATRLPTSAGHASGVFRPPR